MGRNVCGCTTQGPGPECNDGEVLYTVAARALQDLFYGRAITNEEQWIICSLTRLAYIDHLNGWQEGDVKIQRRAGMEMVFTRFSGQWIFQFGTKDDALLVDWLRNRGYQQYVQVKSKRPADQFLGYYRMYGKDDERNNSSERFPAQVREISGDASPILDGRIMAPRSRSAVSSPPSSSALDLATRIAIRIALLVARCTRVLTLFDRLSVQQDAARLLQEHGIVIGQSDERALQEIIDEAVQQKEQLHSRLDRSTRPLSSQGEHF